MNPRIGRTALLALAALLAAPGAMAQAADHWTYSVTPYLWVPDITGTLRFGPPPPGGSSANVGLDAKLDSAFLISANARKGRWSMFTDFVYLDMSTDGNLVKSIDFNPPGGRFDVPNPSVDLGSKLDLRGIIWSAAGGYSLVSEPHASMDVIAGVRYLDIKSTLDWRLGATVPAPGGGANFATSGNVTRSDTFWDGIVGVRGRINLGDGRWFVPYYFDIGAGTAKLTTQAMVGGGYSFGWGDVLVAYRYLHYEQDDDKFVQDLTSKGFGAGVTFHF